MKNFKIVIVIWALSLLCGCERSPGPGVYTANSPTRMVMGTFAHSISVAADKKTAKAANKAAFEKLVEVDEMMSDFLFDSELSKINREAFGGAVKVSGELFEVISKAIEYSHISDGAFDITIGPVVDLWHEAEESKIKPSDEEIAAAKAKVGYEKLIVDAEKKTVRFAVDGMRLDLGAIAKGYGVDKAAEAMKAAGAVGGMVDVGGDIRCFGKPAKKAKWAIGLQDPGKDDILMVIELGDNAIATSGDYLRFVVLDGEKFSHIMAPKKGASAKGLTSVTVIAKTAMDADALATTVTVLGIAKGLELIESIDQAEGFIMPSDPNEEINFSSGFERFVRKK
ncbi:MAG: FAD:protein FMN transferase [Planctomycetes bacterium]|nr:FAD:protein FMN transferase [Planctomycetota bacterium]